ncbi:MAG: GNAT family N-acetyltransferase [Ferruginibacter sp.]
MMHQQPKSPFRGQGLHWTLKKFEALTPVELYRILQLRNEVFVVEQNCPYQDADNKDLAAHHFMGWDGDTLVAYTRLIPPGISYDEASIGRVVSSPKYRGTGAGRALMELSIQNTLIIFNCNTIKIGAQLYLHQFYTSLGFMQCSDEYLEDNIPHIEMIFTK